MSAVAKKLSPPPAAATRNATLAQATAQIDIRDELLEPRPAPATPSHALQEQQRLARAAATRIWQRHRRYLYGLGLRWLRGDRVEAEDAVADVVYKASITIGSGQLDIANERAWLTRILHNRCMDSHRSRCGVRRMEAFPDEAEDRIGGDTNSDRSAEELLLNKELGVMLRMALEELPESLRGPVTMRLIHDEPYTSISEMFRITEANARKRIQQAREILRRRLDVYLRGEAIISTQRQPKLPGRPLPLRGGRRG